MCLREGRIRWASLRTGRFVRRYWISNFHTARNRLCDWDSQWDLYGGRSRSRSSDVPTVACYPGMQRLVSLLAAIEALLESPAMALYDASSSSQERKRRHIQGLSRYRALSIRRFPDTRTGTGWESECAFPRFIWQRMNKPRFFIFFFYMESSIEELRPWAKSFLLDTIAVRS